VFNPVETLAGLFNILFEVVGTALTAFLLPTIQLIVYPILSVLGLFQPR
jgi:hypothetical protein